MPSVHEGVGNEVGRHRWATFYVFFFFVAVYERTAPLLNKIDL